MIKSVFIILVSIIGIPIYALSVVFLYIIGAIFGISYVDSSVYVCEYVQPLFTAAVALVFLIIALIKIPKIVKEKIWCKAVALSVISLSYIAIVGYCVQEFIERVHTYSGMTNRQIFDYVVHKLRVMGEVYPQKSFILFTGEPIGYGYIMANMEVYLLPISIVLLLGLIQWKLTTKLHFDANPCITSAQSDND